MNWLSEILRGVRHSNITDDLRQSRLDRIRFERQRYELELLKRRVNQEIELIIERGGRNVA